jgi:hypothetical protein
MAMPVVAEVQDLFRAVDGGATLALLAKLAMEKACASKLDETRNAIQVRCSCRIWRTKGNEPSRKWSFAPNLALWHAVSPQQACRFLMQDSKTA